MLKLYDYFRSSASYRVRIALNLKGLKYEAVPVHLVNNGGEQHSLDYQTINPQSLVPALDDHGKILTQSLAIIEYLDEMHPEVPLLPKEPYLKAKVRAFALAIAADTHPVNNLRVTQYLTREFNISAEQKLAWYHHFIMLGLSALEKQLVTSTTLGNFCFGDHPSLADICLIPQLYNAKRFDCDLSSCPTLNNIDKHCQTLNAFNDARPMETIT
tara:strand:+ start:1895 stop:2536 length:642 start_codon:yes stop_codon:yes gene_type:complete